MVENVIAFLILAVAILWMGRRFYRSFSGEDKGCGCGQACPRSGIRSPSGTKGKGK